MEGLSYGALDRRSAALALRLEGERIGDYRLERAVGVGGMGTVYEAWQDSPRRRVALKLITGGLSGDSGRLARFRVEARAAGRRRRMRGDRYPRRIPSRR